MENAGKPSVKDRIRGHARRGGSTSVQKQPPKNHKGSNGNLMRVTESIGSDSTHRTSVYLQTAPTGPALLSRVLWDLLGISGDCQFHIQSALGV